MAVTCGASLLFIQSHALSLSPLERRCSYHVLVSRNIAQIIGRNMNDYVPSEILGTLSEVAEIPTVLGPATLTRNNTQTLRLQSLAVVIWLLFREYFRYATT